MSDFTVVDNDNGTATVTPTGATVVDNDNGTASVTAAGAADNDNGTASLTPTTGGGTGGGGGGGGGGGETSTPPATTYSLYPALKFVDRPALNATVRLNLNDGETVTIASEGFSAGSPQLDGPPGLAGREWTYRTVTFTQLIEGSKSQARAAQKALARELLRPRNWLFMQISKDHSPVWLRTYLKQPNPVDLSEVYNDRGDLVPDTWSISVAVDAEPFARGERIELPPVVIENNPALPNGRYVELPEIVGDAPARLTVRASPLRFQGWGSGRVMLSVSSYRPDTSVASPIIWQTGGFYQGADTTYVQGKTNMSNQDASRVTFTSSPGLVTRLSGVAPSTPPPGRYKVLIRVARSGLTAEVLSFRFGQQSTSFNGDNYGDVITPAPPVYTSNYATYDLGEFTFPLGAGPWEAIEEFGQTPPPIVLQAGRLSGSSALDIDCIMLVPVEASNTDQVTTMVTSFPYITVRASDNVRPGTTVVWDGEHETVNLVDAANQLGYERTPSIAGGFLEVVPGARNVLHLHHHYNTTHPASSSIIEGDDEIESATSVVASYQPAILWPEDA